jgi:uncharacterized membrane protein
MTIDPATLAAILAMAGATYFTRIAGVWLASRFALRGRAGAAVDAILGAVLVAVIAPIVIGAGPSGLGAGLVAALAAWRLPLVAAVTIAIVSAALFRAIV